VNLAEILQAASLRAASTHVFVAEAEREGVWVSLGDPRDAFQRTQRRRQRVQQQQEQEGIAAGGVSLPAATAAAMGASGTRSLASTFASASPDPILSTESEFGPDLVAETLALAGAGDAAAADPLGDGAAAVGAPETMPVGILAVSPSLPLALPVLEASFDFSKASAHVLTRDVAARSSSVTARLAEGGVAGGQDALSLLEGDDANVHYRHALARASATAAAADLQTAVLRPSDDWHTLLMQHGAELALLFDRILARSIARRDRSKNRSKLGKTMAEDAVFLDELTLAFDKAGHVWGYAEPMGVGLGKALIADLMDPTRYGEASTVPLLQPFDAALVCDPVDPFADAVPLSASFPLSLSRAALNEAVSTLGQSRAPRAQRLRSLAWAVSAEAAAADSGVTALFPGGRGAGKALASAREALPALLGLAFDHAYARGKGGSVTLNDVFVSLQAVASDGAKSKAIQVLARQITNTLNALAVELLPHLAQQLGAAAVLAEVAPEPAEAAAASTEPAAAAAETTDPESAEEGKDGEEGKEAETAVAVTAPVAPAPVAPEVLGLEDVEEVLCPAYRAGMRRVIIRSDIVDAAKALSTRISSATGPLRVFVSSAATEADPAQADDIRAVASAAASMLDIPMVSVDKLLVDAFLEHEHQVAARKKAIRLHEEAEEKRRKEEEERAKKERLRAAAAKVAGTNNNSSKKPAPAAAKAAPAAAAKAAPAPPVVFVAPEITAADPVANPQGAIVQQLHACAEFKAGFVLTGLPRPGQPRVHALLPQRSVEETDLGDPNAVATSVLLPDAEQLKAALLASDLSPSLVLHAWRCSLTAPLDDDDSALRAYAETRWKHPFGYWGKSLVVNAAESAQAPGLLARRLASQLASQGFPLSAPPPSPVLPQAEDATQNDPEGSSPQSRLQSWIGQVPNAFSISLLSLHESLISRLPDMLAEAFKAFPDRDYMLALVPTCPQSGPVVIGGDDMSGTVPQEFGQAQAPPPILSALVDNGFFFQIPELPGAPLGSHVLYACHRDSLLIPSSVVVRKATPADRKAIRMLVADRHDFQAFMNAIVAAEGQLVSREKGKVFKPAPPHEAPILAVVAELAGCIIGVATMTATGCSAAAVAACARSFELGNAVSPVAFLGARASTGILDSSSFASLTNFAANPQYATAVLPLLLRNGLRFYRRHGLLLRLPAEEFAAHTNVALLDEALLRAFSPVRPVFGTNAVPADEHEAHSLSSSLSLLEYCSGHRFGRGKNAAEAVNDESIEDYAVPVALDGFGRGPEPFDQLFSPYAVTPSQAAASFCLVNGQREPSLSDYAQLSHGLFLFTPRVATVSRRQLVLPRIVVVGASDTSLSFLFTLLFDPTHYYTGLTVVAEGGLQPPSDLHVVTANHDRPVLSFLPARLWTQFDLARVPLSLLATVIDGVAVAMNRRTGQLTIGASYGGKTPDIGLYNGAKICVATMRGNMRIGYDFCVLLPGLSEPTWARMRFPTPEACPRGMHSLSNLPGALNMLESDVDTVLRAFHEGGSALSHGSVCVYGDGFEALTAIAGLIDRGIPSNRIVYVQPRHDIHDAEELFGRSEDDAALAARFPIASLAPTATLRLASAKLLESSNQAVSGGACSASVFMILKEMLGVKCLQGPSLAGVTSMNQQDEHGEDGVYTPLLVEFDVPRVNVNSPAPGSTSPEPIIRKRLPSTDSDGADVLQFVVSLLLCGDSKDVDPRFFKLVNDAGIVYDGRLVVDQTLRATDSKVFSAGQVTRFCKRGHDSATLGTSSSPSKTAFLASSALRRLGPSPAITLSDVSIMGSIDSGKAVAQSLTGALFNAIQPATSPFKEVMATSGMHHSKAVLPWGLQYLHARLGDYERAKDSEEICTISDASPPGKDFTFLRMATDVLGRVCEITYTGPTLPDEDMIFSLLGTRLSFFGLKDLHAAAEGENAPAAVLALLRERLAVKRRGLSSFSFAALLRNLRSLLGGSVQGQSVLSAVEQAAFQSAAKDPWARTQEVNQALQTAIASLEFPEDFTERIQELMDELGPT
jgi:hypothetical protein